MYPLRKVSINNVNLVKAVHESDRFRFPSTFQWSCTRFPYAASKSVWTDLVASVCFGGIRNDSSLGTYFWTLGSIWWRNNRVSLNRPEVIQSFSVIFCFFKFKLFPIALRFSAEILSHYGVFPSQSGFLEFVVSSWLCCWTICHREYKFSVSVGYQDFFCIHSSGISFWCVQLFWFFNISNQNVSFPNSSCDQSITQKDSW